MVLAEKIKRRALELGFDAVGITDALPIDPQHIGYLTDWLKAGFSGQMNYMHRNFQKRINPAELCPQAKSIIVAGLNYKPSRVTDSKPNPSVASGRLAQYAQYEDYHVFIKKILRQLAEFISDTANTKVEFKICVDYVPLAERALAVRAGLGFIGKNHMLIHPELGPQILLGEIISTLKLQADKPGAFDTECSGCKKCIEACPTEALLPDGRFNANKCVSYLTIEHKGRIPSDLSEKTGDRFFGCDECIIVCPYREKAPVCKNKNFRFYSNRATVDLRKIIDMTDAQFEAEFADSPLYRTGLKSLKRNARICLTNLSL